MRQKYDPRNPKPNPEIAELLRTIDKNWNETKTEKEFTARRGRVRVLIALLEMLDEEPEYLPADIEPAAVQAEMCWFPPQAFSDGAPRFLDERPFDIPGTDRNRFFFYTSNGMLSWLYPGPGLDPYYVGDPVCTHGPWVYTLEKRYASPAETTMHFSSLDAVTRATSPSAPDQRPTEGIRYFLLGDPSGFAGGHSAPLIDVFLDLEAAMAKADKLSRALDIRFLVAAVHYSFCTR